MGHEVAEVAGFASERTKSLSSGNGSAGVVRPEDTPPPSGSSISARPEGPVSSSCRIHGARGFTGRWPPTFRDRAHPCGSYAALQHRIRRMGFHADSRHLRRVESGVGRCRRHALQHGQTSLSAGRWHSCCAPTG